MIFAIGGFAPSAETEATAASRGGACLLMTPAAAAPRKATAPAVAAMPAPSWLPFGGEAASGTSSCFSFGFSTLSSLSASLSLFSDLPPAALEEGERKHDLDRESE